MSPYFGRLSDRHGRVLPCLVGLGASGLVMALLPWPTALAAARPARRRDRPEHRHPVDSVDGDDLRRRRRHRHRPGLRRRADQPRVVERADARLGGRRAPRPGLRRRAALPAAGRGLRADVRRARPPGDAATSRWDERRAGRRAQPIVARQRRVAEAVEREQRRARDRGGERAPVLDAGTSGRRCRGRRTVGTRSSPSRSRTERPSCDRERVAELGRDVVGVLERAFSAIRVMQRLVERSPPYGALQLDEVARPTAARSLQSGGSGPPANRPSTGPGRSSSRAAWSRSSTSPLDALRVLDRGDLRDRPPCETPASVAAVELERVEAARRRRPRCRAASTRPVSVAREPSCPASRASRRITYQAPAAGEPFAQLGVPGHHRLARAVQQQHGGIAGRAERLGVQLHARRRSWSAGAQRLARAACGRDRGWGPPVSTRRRMAARLRGVSGYEHGQHRGGDRP